MSETTVVPAAPVAQPDEHLIGEIEKPPAAATEAPSPAAEAPRVEPRPETVRLVEPVIPTFEMLMRKPVRKETIPFLLPQEDGDPVHVQVVLEAIDGPSYDALQGKFPPTPLQRAKSQAFDMDRFGPALLERVVKSPRLTAEQWGQLWTNPSWSGGEISSLFWSANGLCLKGLDVPFTSTD